MKLTRRDMLLWSAGAAAGFAVTPVPWKLLDDVSIWSQNWPWIPQPARGPIDVQPSFCTLCPQGCGLRVRMAQGWPVGIAGMPKHPVSRGALCPLAFGAHQLLWHPQRLRTVRHRGSTSSWEDAGTAFRKACAEGPVLIVDGRPGRAASSLFQTFAQKHRGSYRAIASPETRALAPYESWTGVPASAMGYDLENSQTVVSFGAPLLDGWGTPGRFTRLWAERAAGCQDPQLRLIQIESSFSRTAARAWKWVPVQEGREAALAARLARVLIEDHLVAARGPVPPLKLEEVPGQTGLSAAEVQDLARTMVAQTPAVVMASNDDPAIAALNVVLGAVGARGGIIQRSKPIKPQAAAHADSRKVRAVLIDSTVPWNYSPNVDAEVFRFATWDVGSNPAEWLLPAPGFLEELTDIPTPPASAIETYAVAPALVEPPETSRSMAAFLASIDSDLLAVDKVIHARCEGLFHARSGTLVGAQTMPVAKFASVQKLEEELRKCAVWAGDPVPAAGLRCSLKEWPTGSASAPESWPAAWAAPVLPPLATKLYEESGLREASDRRMA